MLVHCLPPPLLLLKRHHGPSQSCLEVVSDRLHLTGPIDKHLKVVNLLRQRCRKVTIVLQTPPTAEDVLRRVGIFPKFWCRCLRLELYQLVSCLGCVKDSRATPLTALPRPRIV